ncbi:MAG: hypothetical protein IK099_07555 [Clostridia bacterium]|nr:hypothetical protein [Clostridia bacterium]
MAKRLIALGLTLVLICSASVAFADTVSDRIHFVPTVIKVTSDSVTVEGYFVNLNTSYYVENFRNFTLRVYMDGDLLLKGDFGTLNKFSVSPLGTRIQSFTWNGRQGLKTGTYSCDDSFNCTWSGSFTQYR